MKLKHKIQFEYCDHIQVIPGVHVFKLYTWVEPCHKYFPIMCAAVSSTFCLPISIQWCSWVLSGRTSSFTLCWTLVELQIIRRSVTGVFHHSEPIAKCDRQSEFLLKGAVLSEACQRRICYCWLVFVHCTLSSHFWLPRYRTNHSDRTKGTEEDYGRHELNILPFFIFINFTN